jgi:2-C-methyl-D-erythritol 4-phosphate cytidylyltransferase/2-C-methyl-D-erythritol 2,4-cyclodiphosphate synthase
MVRLDGPDGGATRALSVQAGLAALADRPADEPVLVHDAARPFVTPQQSTVLLAALADADGAVPALPDGRHAEKRGRRA